MTILMDLQYHEKHKLQKCIYQLIRDIWTCINDSTVIHITAVSSKVLLVICEIIYEPQTPCSISMRDNLAMYIWTQGSLSQDL